MTISRDELRVGDTVGHPIWSGSSYICTAIEEHNFFLQIGGTNVDFPFFNENFFIANKLGKREKKKSGFAKFINRVEQYG